MNPELEELACLYVLDRLDARERASFEARLLHDPQLAAFVGEMESALARRVGAVPRIDPPASIIDRIERGIDGPGSGVAREPASAHPAPWARWGIAALIAVGVGVVAAQLVRRGSAPLQRPFVIIVGMDPSQSTLAELPLQRRAQDADGRFIQLASLAEQFWEKPGDLPEKLRPTGPNGHGYALYDPASSQGFVAIEQLPAIGKDKRYHLWIVDTASGQTREAGILPLAGSSSGLYFFSVSPNLDARPDRLDFFVTIEDNAASGSARPTGKVVIGDGRFF